jgi:hypothetical protein
MKSHRGGVPPVIQRQVGAAARFVDEKLTRGLVTFTLSELTGATGLSAIAARNQILHLGSRVARVAARQEFFVIVSPEHRLIGGPPVLWWLDAYFEWLGRPYYLALQSAAAEYGATPQAVQVVQVMTDRPRRTVKLGRLRVQFYVKASAATTPTQALRNAHAPLSMSTPEVTCLDLVRYASRIGGIERAAETIAPMLTLLDKRRILDALSAEGDIATAQRFGYLLDGFKRQQLAATVRRHLPARLKKIALETAIRKSTPESVDLDERWAVSGSFRLGTNS